MCGDEPVREKNNITIPKRDRWIEYEHVVCNCLAWARQRNETKSDELRRAQIEINLQLKQFFTLLTSYSAIVGRSTKLIFNYLASISIAITLLMFLSFSISFIFQWRILSFFPSHSLHTPLSLSFSLSAVFSVFFRCWCLLIKFFLVSPNPSISTHEWVID